MLTLGAVAAMNSSLYGSLGAWGFMLGALLLTER